VTNRLGVELNLKSMFLPRNNHWFRRAILVFVFILFDYVSTLVFCRAPHEEANLYARMFMENLGIFSGLTLFVLVFNLPIYVTLSLDSHIVRLPAKIASFFELGVDLVFAWFVAGSHFNGGASWFWPMPELTRQAIGALLYFTIAFLLVKPHRPRYENKRLTGA
jgi:hypothetical protein